MRLLIVLAIVVGGCNSAPPARSPCTRIAAAYCARCLPALRLQHTSPAQCEQAYARGCGAAAGSSAARDPARLEVCLRAFEHWDCSGYAPPECSAPVTVK